MNERNEKLIYVCSLMPGECTCDPESRMFCVPVQVRELIFDEPQRPIYDADLVDEE